MSWTPISGAPTQFQKSDGTLASGYYLKFYSAGTTSPTSMATNSTGSTTLAKCEINSSGYPINGSGDVFIPHLSVNYKIVLYKNSTDADSDNTNNADWVVDNVTQSAAANPTQTIEIEEKAGSDAVGQVFTLSTITYTIGVNSLSVYRNGVRQRLGIGKDYQETSSSSITVNSSITINPGDNWLFVKGESTTSTVSDAASVTYTPSGTGAVSTNVQDKLRETVSVTDYGAVGGGIVNDTLAFTNAIATGKNVYIPNGIYLVDSITLANRGQSLIGEQMGTAGGLDIGVVIRCRSSITDFFTVESAVGIRVENLNIDGNNLATNTVRISNNITDASFEFLTISGCVDSGVNLNLQPKTTNTQVSELSFHRVLCAGRVGGSNITNMLCDSNQFLVNSFYDCKWFGNSDGDVSKNIDIVQGQVNLYTPFFTGLTASGAFDINVSGGDIDVYSGRSESAAVDSIYVTGGSRINLYDYVHGATISNTTYAHTAAFTGQCKIVGGSYTNISLTGTSSETILINPQLYSGGVLSGTGAATALILGSLGRTGRDGFEVAQSTLTNLRGISASDEASKNLTGAFSISNTDTTAVVTLSTAEADALYYVLITPYDSTGAPAAGAFTVTDIARTTSNFTVTVSAAPGASNSVSYGWLLVRYG